MMKDIYLTTEDALLIDDCLLFVSRETNAICTIDIKKGAMDVVGELPEEDMLGKRLCSKIIKNNDSIIFVPMNAKRIWMCDLQYRNWESIEIEKADLAMKFMQGFLVGKELVLIGCFYPAILRIDLKTGCVTYYKEVHENLSNKTNDIPFFRRDFVNHEKSFLVASCRSNEVFEVNIDTWEYSKYTVGDGTGGYSGITWDGRDYWLSLWDGSGVVKWNRKRWNIIETNLKKNIDTVSNTGICFDSIQKRIIVPSRDSERTIYIDIENDDVVEKNENGYLFYSIDSDKTVYGLSTGIIGVLKNGEKYELSTHISKENIINEKIFTAPVLENDVIGLSDYLDYFCEDVES